MQRRQLLQFASLFSLSLALNSPARANTEDPILVMVYLKGGNDALNTVTPIDNVQYPAYQTMRPNLAWPLADLIPLNSTLGLAPPLEPLLKHFDAGQLAVLLGTGVPRTTPSLFAHNDQRTVWETGNVTSITPTQKGWLAQYLTNYLGGSNNPLLVFEGTAEIPQLLSSDTLYPTGAMRTLDQYGIDLGGLTPEDQQLRSTVFNRILGYAPRSLTLYPTQWLRYGNTISDSFDLAAQTEPTVAYPASDLGRQLESVGRLIQANTGQRIFWCELADFDTHADQNNNHPGLLADLAGSLDAFWTDMGNLGLHNRVVVVTYSEFGRRPSENSALGTDHGMAGMNFVLGGKVKGGVYGSYTPLNWLVGLRYTPPFYDNLATTAGMEFYNIYATILQKHMGLVNVQSFFNMLNPTKPYTVTPLDFMV